jgi:hypothetical protein
MELLPAIVGLAVVDSINPSALLATIVLLLRGRRARPLVAVYVVAVLATYFAIGTVLTLGLGHVKGSQRIPRLSLEVRQMPSASPVGGVGTIASANR